MVVVVICVVEIFILFLQNMERTVHHAVEQVVEEKVFSPPSSISSNSSRGGCPRRGNTGGQMSPLPPQRQQQQQPSSSSSPQAKPQLVTTPKMNHYKNLLKKQTSKPWQKDSPSPVPPLSGSSRRRHGQRFGFSSSPSATSSLSMQLGIPLLPEFQHDVDSNHDNQSMDDNDDHDHDDDSQSCSSSTTSAPPSKPMDVLETEKDDKRTLEQEQQQEQQHKQGDVMNNAGTTTTDQTNVMDNRSHMLACHPADDEKKKDQEINMTREVDSIQDHAVQQTTQEEDDDDRSHSQTSSLITTTTNASQEEEEDEKEDQMDSSFMEVVQSEQRQQQPLPSRQLDDTDKDNHHDNVNDNDLLHNGTLSSTPASAMMATTTTTTTTEINNGHQQQQSLQEHTDAAILETSRHSTTSTISCTAKEEGGIVDSMAKSTTFTAAKKKILEEEEQAVPLTVNTMFSTGPMTVDVSTNNNNKEEEDVTVHEFAAIREEPHEFQMTDNVQETEEQGDDEEELPAVLPAVIPTDNNNNDDDHHHDVVNRHITVPDSETTAVSCSTRDDDVEEESVAVARDDDDDGEEEKVAEMENFNTNATTKHDVEEEESAAVAKDDDDEEEEVAGMESFDANATTKDDVEEEKSVAVAKDDEVSPKWSRREFVRSTVDIQTTITCSTVPTFDSIEGCDAEEDDDSKQHVLPATTKLAANAGAVRVPDGVSSVVVLEPNSTGTNEDSTASPTTVQQQQGHGVTTPVRVKELRRVFETKTTPVGDEPPTAKTALMPPSSAKSTKSDDNSNSSKYEKQPAFSPSMSMFSGRKIVPPDDLSDSELATPNAATPKYFAGGMEVFFRQQKLQKFHERRRLNETWIRYHCGKEEHVVVSLLEEPSAQAQVFGGDKTDADESVNNDEVLVDYRAKDYRGFVFLVHDEHGLVLLQCAHKKKKPPHWQLPGGHVDEKEFLEAGTFVQTLF